MVEVIVGGIVVGIIVLIVEYYYVIPKRRAQLFTPPPDPPKPTSVSTPDPPKPIPEPKSVIVLRRNPITLSNDNAKAMIIEKGFYDKNKNPNGAGLPDNYEVLAGGKVVYDRSTGLMWQQSGSSAMEYKDVQDYITPLNKEKFAGYQYWRLPTLEEAMSLVKPVKYILHIAPVFDERQPWIWTADRYSASRAWSVTFDGGGCGHGDVGNNIGYVRAVRSGQS